MKMYPVSHDFQMAIKEAKKDQSTHLSLRGDKGNIYGSNILFAIPEAVFDLSELETLDLSNNLLRALPPELVRLKKLKQINIALNPLDEILDRPGLILDSDQALQFVEENNTSTLPNVVGIRFRRSGLKRMKHWFASNGGPFQHIEWLDLSQCLLQALPESITQLKSLVFLNLSSNNLSAVPESITQLQNLVFLNLSSNNLSAVPESITQLQNLASLNLSYNNLSAVPESITKLTNLTGLNLANNLLNTLPEAITQLTNLSSLILWTNQLGILPESITQLTNLTSLFLSNNQLSTLPESITQLTNLTYLNLRLNELTTLPESIAQLTHLISLDLSDNQLSTLPESIAQLTHFISLDLSKNQLSILPESITQLTSLSSLDLRNNKLDTLPESIAQLTNLTYLNLSDNQLSPLPESITQLTNLASLNLGWNQLSTLPESITQLTHLTYLNLSNNKLDTVPEPITQLTHLTSLDLSGNQLSTLPESITHLTNLTSLGLNGNQLSTLPESITQMTNLISLGLSGTESDFTSVAVTQVLKLTRGNTLETLPKSITQMTNLTSLFLNENQISVIPEFINQMTSLTFLRLGGNKLSALPESITQMTNLTVLNLEGNKLSILPESIRQMTNLTCLNLGYNELDTLPEAITRLTNLTSLDLGNNKLDTLPESITQLKNLTSLDLSYNNPFTSPPHEVIEKGIRAIEDYFQQAAEQGGTFPLYEARILIVGEAGAGKTTLKKKLLNPDYQLPEKGERSTLGIEVENNWTFPFVNDDSIQFTAHLWDFGGQEIQYMTHQFFLRDRSLYILVADNRRQDADFDYWFKAIHLFGKGSPVLVVLNERNYKSVTNFELNYYKKLYPELEIHQFSVDLGEDKERILKLTRQVQTLTSKLKHVGDKIPKQWVPIREALTAREAEHHISFKDFLSICKGHKVEDEQSVLNISGYLDALGLIVHFKDDPNLNDFVIVDPKWLVEAVYAVLEDKTLEENKGRFTQDWIFKLWKQKGYKHDECCKLISLIKKDSFEICYELKNHEVSTYIAPQLLPSIEPEYEWEQVDNLHFRFAYPFMPKGIMARLIVRMSEHVAQNAGEPLIWKRGAVFKEGKTRAEVTHLDDPETGVESINIRVQGKARGKRDLLTVVRSELRHLHQRSFQNIKFSELIPCSGHVCSKKVEPKLFKFQEVEDTVKNGRSIIYCTICNEEISIRQMLEGIIDPCKGQHRPDSSKREGDHIINVYNSVKQETEININIDIKNETILEFTGLLETLKEDLLDEIEDQKSKTKLEKEIGKVEKAVSEIGAVSSPEEAKTKTGALSRIKRFVEKLQDGSTTAGKAIGALEDGLGYAQDLAALYNKIGPWAGMPKVPDFLLKKKDG